MRIGILDDPSALSDYIAQIFKTWGLCLFDTIAAEAVDSLDPGQTPVLICPGTHPRPRQDDGPRADALTAYARRGGTILCFLPRGALAAAAGLEEAGEKPGEPLRLRVAALSAAGLAGEALPIVGPARAYQPASDDLRILAYLVHPHRYEGESPGLTERPVGRGRILAFAFDLPRCVLLLRQGDPAKGQAEWLPPGDDAWFCAEHLACEIGPHDAGWVPYADLLARLLVDQARRHLPGPAPMLWHLPAEALGILLYSGDEDTAEVAWNDQEMEQVAAAGGRMNLYIIPEQTHSTPADARRYRAGHDLGPHPNLRPLDGRPAAERLAEYERQVRVFQERFGVTPRTVRNHCLAWVEHTRLPELQEKLGIRMDANYLCGGGFMRHRTFAPYSDFGAAMPMRFCRPEGELIDVFQQHFHVEDDAWFSDWITYSAKLAPGPYETIIERCFDDIAHRFHTPLGVNFHPSNWVKFSGDQGRTTLQRAAERGLPAWSFDQWCAFWDARDTWEFQGVAWDGRELRFTAAGRQPHDDLRLLLPLRHETATLSRLELNGAASTWQTATRYRQPVATAAFPAASREVEVRAVYG